MHFFVLSRQKEQQNIAFLRLMFVIVYANKFPYIILMTATDQYFLCRLCNDSREMKSGV